MKVRIVALLALTAGCYSPALSEWNRPVARWGSLREVLREGRSEGRVRVSDVTTRETVGIGLGVGLAEELVIIGGEFWSGRSEQAGAWSVQHGPTSDSQATFLVAANVSQWRAIEIEHAVEGGDFERWLEDVGAKHGLGATWPFVIEGCLAELEAHVLRGACPLADPSSPAPTRPPWTSAAGRLVGFFALGGDGRITHHGQRTHVHVIVDMPEPFVGHVDAVRLPAGAVLHVPLR